MPLRAIIQFLILLIGVAFEAVRVGQGEVKPFLLINYFGVHRDEYWMGTEWLRGYIYNFAAHIQWLAVLMMMWLGSRAEDFKTDRLFVILAVADFIDYILWGNNLWFSVTLIPHENGYGLILPMSMNVLSLIVFGLYVLKEWKTNGNQL